MAMEIPRSQKFVFQSFSLFSVRVFKVFFSQAEPKLLCLFVQSLYPRHVDMPNVIGSLACRKSEKILHSPHQRVGEEQKSLPSLKLT